MLRTNSQAKDSKKISQEVKEILQEKGFSNLFNWNDYNYFKTKVKKAFNKAQAISELFLNENESAKSDFNEYIF